MRWALSWLLYGLGDLVHRWNDNDRRFTDAGYHLYQWLILASDTVQGDGPNGPWGAASAMSAFGQDAEERLEAKPASAVPKADAQ